MTEPITGGCHCGAVRYKIAEELGFSFACYCDSCRKLGSGARLTAVGTDEAALDLDGRVSTYRSQGGKSDIDLLFCPTCGTQIYARPAAYPGRAIIRIGTLDEEDVVERIKPIFVDQACSWDALP